MSVYLAIKTSLALLTRDRYRKFSGNVIEKCCQKITDIVPEVRDLISKYAFDFLFR